MASEAYTLKQFTDMAQHVKQTFMQASFEDEEVEAKRQHALAFINALMRETANEASIAEASKNRLAEYLYFHYQNL